MTDGSFISTVAINSSAGALTTLYGTILSRQIQIIEDFSSGSNPNGQGLIYYTVDPLLTTNPANPAWRGPFEIAPPTEPLILGDPPTIHQPYGSIVSNGPNVLLGVGVTAALPYMQIKSAGSATTIRVTEFS